MQGILSEFSKTAASYLGRAFLDPLRPAEASSFNLQISQDIANDAGMMAPGPDFLKNGEHRFQPRIQEKEHVQLSGTATLREQAAL
ncbi:hypothetical protein M407DRAFT_17638 [Tulasnella calospora MUT 4182]|uniref:Uncharacterized protein n=1 Tax=Tulasnella calospora MUT 4182 TaxID=1051891 RepID=A0A0C3QXC0_9AGAM|nr:hypothetical protein M407DRAFT_17638 [Tulasnella calospora MUT 4182]